MWWLVACTTERGSETTRPDTSDSGTDWTPTTPIDFASCPQTQEPLSPTDAPLGFSADEVVAALVRPESVRWVYSQTALSAEAAPTDLVMGPLAVGQVFLVTYPPGTCEPAEQLAIATPLAIDIGTGGLVAGGTAWLYAWGTAPDQVKVWTDDTLSLTFGSPFAGAFDTWVADTGLLLEAVELRVGSAWSAIGISVEVSVTDGTDPLVADLWAGTLE